MISVQLALLVSRSTLESTLHLWRSSSISSSTALEQTLDHKNIHEKCLSHLLTLTKSMPLLIGS